MRSSNGHYGARSMRLRFGLGLSAAMFALAPGAASAQTAEYLCDRDPELPCDLGIESFALQKGPSVFKFQARVSQTKLPSGNATFSEIRVRLIDGVELLCDETIRNVRVRQGVLNLDVGRGMDCELDELIAERDGLRWDICLGASDDTCLGGLALPTVPYAVKSNLAEDAVRAVSATEAANANWAHRALADAEIALRDEYMTGYFDFYAHVAADAENLYPTADEYAPYAQGAFIQWTPVRQTNAMTLKIGAGAPRTGIVARLRRLAFATRAMRLTGGLTIAPTQPGVVGLTVEQGGLQVNGDSTVTGTLGISQDFTVEAGGMTIRSDGGITGNLEMGLGANVTGNATVGTQRVTDTTTVQRGDFVVQAGGAQVGGGFSVRNDLVVNGSMDAERFGPLGQGDLTIQNGNANFGNGAVSFGPTLVGANITSGFVAPLLSAGPAGRIWTLGGVVANTNVNVGSDVLIGTDMNVGGNMSTTGDLYVSGGINPRISAEILGVTNVAGTLDMYPDFGGFIFNTLRADVDRGLRQLTVPFGINRVRAGIPLYLGSDLNVAGNATFNSPVAITGTFNGGGLAATGILRSLESTRIEAYVGVETPGNGTTVETDLAVRGGSQAQRIVVNGTTTIAGGIVLLDDAACFEGFRAEGGRCVDIDECAVDPGVCGTRDCVNRPGYVDCCYELVDGSRNCRRPNERMMFVSRDTYSINQFNNNEDADAICTNAAAAVGFGGFWTALISDSTRPINGFDRVRGDVGPFVVLTGVKIANNRDDLFDDSLNAPPQRDEYGNLVALDSPVWSGSTGMGLAIGADCDGWTNQFQTTRSGRVGRPTLNNVFGDPPWVWLDTNNQSCSTPQHFYCFEF